MCLLIYIYLINFCRKTLILRKKIKYTDKKEIFCALYFLKKIKIVMLITKKVMGGFWGMWSEWFVV